MNIGSLIAIYLPFFIIFFVVLPQQRTLYKAILLRIKKRKGVVKMTNELIKRYIGKQCLISTGSFGTSVKGIIIDVNENWLEIETKKGSELINAEFIQSIKIT
ncbi:DUF6897 domain-containing protein [Desulfosporosinus sp. BICA1-9]|uniref:DUF6897 domain-containing protein n=1 Tax=Desulfosporosinus sp. BICA1-9 TaxID=1531958 RepID=UPI00054C1A32|nr:hypothetical protein [Desulfosporosinus sp. BICA1-9]KJS47952.1 MAG: hypothetical protein VR66_16800 [Peptococcaceae bacterium BRH_c23]KJS83230.1 MAG: hypothetical protein JL57_23115 [Desulfosporosinus sp. BICA1-9]HBW38995.1 hypothetical protein [Desulfosporosinus sp.]